MGEKLGGMTNMILVLAALVVVVIFVNTMYPNITDDIGAGMTNIINDSLNTLSS